MIVCVPWTCFLSWLTSCCSLPETPLKRFGSISGDLHEAERSTDKVENSLHGRASSIIPLNRVACQDTTPNSTKKPISFTKPVSKYAIFPFCITVPSLKSCSPSDSLRWPTQNTALLGQRLKSEEAKQKDSSISGTILTVEQSKNIASSVRDATRWLI